MQYFKLNVEERIGINAQCINVRKKPDIPYLVEEKKNPTHKSAGWDSPKSQMHRHFYSLPRLRIVLLLPIVVINGLNPKCQSSSNI